MITAGGGDQGSGGGGTGGLASPRAMPPVTGSMAGAPLVSVVVPVHGVERFLQDCLGSILTTGGAAGPDRDSGPVVEVIAVDDASPDGCGELLDRRAKEDPRLTVIHLERNAGPGAARNLGLARATGEYVWFVDGDDMLEPGALAAVERRLRAGSEPGAPAQQHASGSGSGASGAVSRGPDLLLIDYADLYPDGSTAVSPGAAILRSAPAAQVGLADAPELVNLTMTSWSKLYRREFLIGLREPFRDGIHEDVPVTCAALLAGRIAVLPEVCYRYRRSRPGSYMVTPGAGHRAIFSAYAEVFEMAARRAAAGDPVMTAQVRSALFERAIWHYTTVLQATWSLWPPRRRGLVPARDRRRFFRRMHQDFARYRPHGYSLPGGARGAKLRLVQANAYLAYTLLEPLNQVRVRLRAALGPGDGGRGRPA